MRRAIASTATAEKGRRSRTMTSPENIEPNRNRSTRCTRLASERGKSIAKLNALKHGLTAETVVLPHEDAAAI
jgi:hypothetical protein